MPALSIVLPSNGCFPHEDRHFGGQTLYVDLIPVTCWFTNVRSAVKSKDWSSLRQVLLSRCEGKCEICGKTHEIKKPLEAHERWDYDVDHQVQRLVRLLMLCKACHRSTHFGLAEHMGLGFIALKHLMKVNGWSEEQAKQHIKQAFQLWRSRNSQTWNLDISMLTG